MLLAILPPLVLRRVPVLREPRCCVVFWEVFFIFLCSGSDVVYIELV